jgi:small subunit ribosomal protein S3
MGHKVNPIGFRIAAGRNWSSQWFVEKKLYSKNLLEDLKIRKYLMVKLKLAGITSVEIVRFINKMKVVIPVSRPGVVIGHGGAGLEEIKKALIPMVSINQPEKNLQIEVVEVKNPDLSAQLVAARIASDIERRLPFRRVAKKTMERVMMSGAKGIRIILSGRIDGAEIARRERFVKGSVPLGTIRADIDYASAPALTKSGYVGIRVWIYK